MENKKNKSKNKFYSLLIKELYNDDNLPNTTKTKILENQDIIESSELKRMNSAYTNVIQKNKKVFFDKIPGRKSITRLLLIAAKYYSATGYQRIYVKQLDEQKKQIQHRLEKMEKKRENRDDRRRMTQNLSKINKAIEEFQKVKNDKKDIELVKNIVQAFEAICKNDQQSKKIQETVIEYLGIEYGDNKRQIDETSKSSNDLFSFLPEEIQNKSKKTDTKESVGKYVPSGKSTFRDIELNDNSKVPVSNKKSKCLNALSSFKNKNNQKDKEIDDSFLNNFEKPKKTTKKKLLVPEPSPIEYTNNNFNDNSFNALEDFDIPFTKKNSSVSSKENVKEKKSKEEQWFKLPENNKINSDLYKPEEITNFPKLSKENERKKFNNIWEKEDISKMIETEKQEDKNEKNIDNLFPIVSNIAHDLLGKCYTVVRKINSQLFLVETKIRNTTVRYINRKFPKKNEIINPYDDYEGYCDFLSDNSESDTESNYDDDEDIFLTLSKCCNESDDWLNYENISKQLNLTKTMF